MTDPPLPAANMAGTVTASVLNTPVRLMSMTSRHCRGGIIHTGPPGGEMPALAHTIYSRPSVVTPPSTACCSWSRSRTSARVRIACRPVFPTSREVFVEILLGAHGVGHGVDADARIHADDVGAFFGQP